MWFSSIIWFFVFKQETAYEMCISDWRSGVCSSDPVAVSMGICVQRSVAFAWILVSVLSTLGAIICLSGKSVSFLASEIGLAALPVALLAGFESIGGVLLAGIIVGIIQDLVMA